MSKLSSSLKTLVNAPAARPGPVPAPRHIEQLFHSIAKDAASRNLNPRSWLAISVSYSRASYFLNAVIINAHLLRLPPPSH